MFFAGEVPASYDGYADGHGGVFNWYFVSIQVGDLYMRVGI